MSQTRGAVWDWGFSCAACAALALTATTGAHAADLQARRATGTITIDGQLDEPDWQKAPEATGFHLLAARRSSRPKAQTRFRILADGEAIYVGVVCAEPMMPTLKAHPVDRDGQVFAEDCIELFFDPAGRGVEYYQLALSANNDQWDQYYIESGNTTIGPYSSRWTSAVHKDKRFWSAEIRVPLSSLFHTRTPEFRTEWKLNLARERKPVGELSTWSPLSGGFHEPARFRTVGGMPRKKPDQDLAVTAVQPLVTGTRANKGYKGELTLKTFASKEAAGKYRVSVWAGDVSLAKPSSVRIAAGNGTARLRDVAFPKAGRVDVRIELARTTGQPVLGLYYPVHIDYQPLVLDVVEPFYADCIFPGQKVERIRGSVRANLPDDVLAGSTVVLALSGSAVTKPVSRSERFVDGKAEFALDASGLKTGGARIDVKVIAGGKTVAQAARTIRKLAPNAGGSTVYVDRHLNLVVNGRPVFLRGWYGAGVWMVSQKIRDRWPEARDAYPHADYGDQVGVEPERVDPADRRNAQRDVRPSQKVMDGIRRRVEKARSDPKVWWYYLCDEPECRGISPVYLKHAYDRIKQLDPYHPVLVISRSPGRYVDCADVLSPHPYLNPMVDSSGKRTMRSVKRIRDQVRRVLAGARARKLPWLTPQAFSYGFVNRYAEYPNFAESRSMVWTAVANGCKGFLPYIYHGSLDRPDLFLGYRCFYGSLAKLESILLAPTPPLPVTVEPTLPDGVDVMVRQHEGQTLVVAVNVLAQPVKARVASAALKRIHKLQRFREPGVVPVADGSIELAFQPYQAHVLTDPALDAGLATITNVRAAIDRANANMRREGNILYGRGREIEYRSSSTYIGARSLQMTLTDGNRENVGWRHLNGKTPPWVELAFPTFVPQFRTMLVFGNRLGGMQAQYWKRGEWRDLGTAPAGADDDAAFKLVKPVRTVKLRLTLPNSRRGHVDAGELYELELYPDLRPGN